MALVLKLLLLFTLSGYNLACYEKKYETEVFQTPNPEFLGIHQGQQYGEYEDDNYGEQEQQEPQLIKKIHNSTITCSNLNSLNTILYPYVETDYDQILKIIDSNISQINPLELSKFSTITRLYLDAVHVKVIFAGAFSGLIRLEELYLNDNELSELSKGVYNSLHRLKVLNLANNRIHVIDRQAFMGTGSLAQLDLKNNNLSVIEKGTFEILHRLKYLDVSQNPLNEFPFNDLSNIESLILAETELNKINGNLSNSPLNLFNMSSCQLSNVDFDYFPSLLETIDLSFNKIEVIENLQVLDTTSLNLNNNKIKKLDVEISIKEFHITHNEIEILESLSSGSFPIHTVDLSYNKIFLINKNFFQNMTSLDLLLLRSNKITKIDPVLFRSLSNLKILDLSNNKIEEFQYGTFDGLSSLQILNISCNKLFDLHQYTFNSLLNLRFLYFDNNRISSLDVIYLKRHLPQLLTVSLNQNPWECKELVKIKQDMKVYKIEIISGHSYDVENFHGIACTNSKKFEASSGNNLTGDFQNAINEAVKNSKIERYFNSDFEDSKFVKYFDEAYSESNFFKFFNNYKFSVMTQQTLNDSKMEKLVASQTPTDENSQKIVIFGVVILVIISVLLVSNMYLTFTFLKKISQKIYKPVVSSQMELC